MATNGSARVGTKVTVSKGWRDPASMYQTLIRKARKALAAGDTAEAQKLLKLSEQFFGKDSSR